MQNQGTTQGLTVNKEESGDLTMNTPANNSKKRVHDSHSPDGEDTNLDLDDKLAKKQRRLVKNREAAAQFRHRQKAYMQKLEKHAEELTQSNIQVTAKIELLDTENKLMKEQLAYLRNFMKQAVALSFPNSLPSLPPDSVVPPDIGPATSQPVIPDLFPDDVSLPSSSVDTKTSIKIEPSIVPDITNVNPASVVPSNSANTTPSPSPSSSPFATPQHPTTINPTKLTLTPTPSFVTPTNILTDPYLAASTIPTSNIPPTVSPPSLSSTPPPTASSPSPLLGPTSNLVGSTSLSSIFNSILGTDLNFSGVLVKNEPLDPPNQA